MTALPIVLHGEHFAALVVGGGEVATRKARALLEGGARVTVIAPDIAPALTQLAAVDARLTLHARRYEPADIQRATIVVAATDDSVINAGIARDALALGRLVNVADDPDAGNFVTPSVHRSGDVTIAVSTGRVPAAAAAIRAAIAERFDDRYARVVASLRALRVSMLEAGKRDQWRDAAESLRTDEFCAAVEDGSLERRIAEWR